MEDKKAYNYKSLLEQPNFIQKITKDFSLSSPLSVFDAVVFIGTIIAMATVFFPLRNIISSLPAGWVFNYILIPYGVVQLFKRFEPDGKKIHRYVFDYVVFWIKYVIPKKQLNKGKFIEYNKDLLSYKKIEQ